MADDWGQTFVQTHIRGNGKFPLVQVSFLGPDLTLAGPPEMTGASLSDQEWRAAYKGAVPEVVRTSMTPYLAVGNEVNLWYEKYGAAVGDPNGFQHSVSLYLEIYDAVKELSPQTRVFSVFAREMVAEQRQANLGVLRMFKPEKLDLLVFTSYPHAVQGINRPADIPDDYYARAFEYCWARPWASVN